VRRKGERKGERQEIGKRYDTERNTDLKKGTKIG
jgi:hypothetical protein